MSKDSRIPSRFRAALDLIGDFTRCQSDLYDIGHGVSPWGDPVKRLRNVAQALKHVCRLCGTLPVNYADCVRSPIQEERGALGFISMLARLLPQWWPMPPRPRN
jgi:hypothetical protein